MATNVFYRLPSDTRTRIITLPRKRANLKHFWDGISIKEGLNDIDFILAYEKKILRPSTSNLDSVNLSNDCQVDILIPLVGGKGGFGSLLRAIGAQIEKTTNRDACRDLQGRRLRDVKKEEELRKLIALQEKLLEERKRRKKEKLEKLRKSAKQTETTMPIQELIDMFEDKEYNKRRHDIGDIIDAAVNKGIINSKRRQNDDGESGSSTIGDVKRLKTNRDRSAGESVPPKNEGAEDDEPCSKTASALDDEEKSKAIETSQPVLPKTNNLWLGLESDEDEVGC